jgi:hypothetical protein
MLILEKISFEIFRQPLADLVFHFSVAAGDGVYGDFL